MTADKLLLWYSIHRRDLPWRRTKDPYAIWLSEIMLQQTRVEQGRGYWLQFMERFPTVHHLANAPEQEVLRLWQGLGYYSRARNLHRTAKAISTGQGVFPNTASELAKLPGIGPYTAAAIASICFEEQVPVLDGNVFRVMSRLHALAEPIDVASNRKLFAQVAQPWVDHPSPGDVNQALMELGATVCTPKKPDCSGCPLASNCKALALGRTEEFPVKIGKTKVKVEHLHFLLLRTSGGIVLEQRPTGNYWANLWQPLLLNHASPSWSGSAVQKEMKLQKAAVEVGRATHLLSHRKLHLVLWEGGTVEKTPRGQVIPLDQVHTYPFPIVLARLLAKVLDLPLDG